MTTAVLQSLAFPSTFWFKPCLVERTRYREFIEPTITMDFHGLVTFGMLSPCMTFPITFMPTLQRFITHVITQRHWVSTRLSGFTAKQNRDFAFTARTFRQDLWV